MLKKPSLLGVKLEFHFSLLLFIPALFILNILDIYLQALLFLFLHELAHVIAAWKFGRKPEKIIFSPLGLSAIIGDIEFLRLSKRLVIYSSGLICNFVIACLFFWNHDVFLINICLILLNILPVYHLDGGKLVFTLVSKFKGFLYANRLVLLLGKLFSYLLCIVGIVQIVLFPFNFSLLSLGLFLLSFSRDAYCRNLIEFYKNIYTDQRKIESAVLPLKCFVVANPLKKDLIALLSWDYVCVFQFSDKTQIKEAELVGLIIETGIKGTIR